LDKGNVPLPGAVAAGITSQSPQSKSSGPTSGALGPLYGSTVGGPVDFSGLSTGGQLLGGAGSPADAGPAALTGPEADRQTVAREALQTPFFAADPIGAAHGVGDSGHGIFDDELVAAFLTGA
jgi:hypothetical protein